MNLASGLEEGQPQLFWGVAAGCAVASGGLMSLLLAGLNRFRSAQRHHVQQAHRHTAAQPRSRTAAPPPLLTPRPSLPRAWAERFSRAHADAPRLGRTPIAARTIDYQNSPPCYSRV